MDEILPELAQALSPLEARLCRYGLNEVVKRGVEAAPAKSKKQTIPQYLLPLAGGETPNTRFCNHPLDHKDNKPLVGDELTHTLAILLIGLVCVTSGCTVCSANRVFPKVTWAWTKEAKMERESRKADKAYHDSLK